MKSHSRQPRLVTWVKRFGLAGFLFFLVKGLIWLAVFAFAGTQLADKCN